MVRTNFLTGVGNLKNEDSEIQKGKDAADEAKEARVAETKIVPFACII